MGKLLAKLLDSYAKGFLAKLLTGAGLTFASTTVMTSLIQSYINNLKYGTGSLSADMLAILNLSSVDYALSVVLSAVASRMLIDGVGLSLKRK